MKRTLVAVLALSVAGSVATADAQQNPAPAPGRPAPGPGAAPGPQPGRGPGPQLPANGGGEIRGAVVDAESGAPIGAASVAVWSRADSALVTGAVVRPDGSFRIEGLRPGNYYLKVSAPGYASHVVDEMPIAGPTALARAGSIKLAKSAVALEGITVTGERGAVSIAPDRNTYQAKDLAPAGGTASDVLQATPSVQVDADGKVSLRGNENVVVQINGRPAPIRGAQLAGYLRQLPANLLDRVEVVPNPSAKYDPEGMAGIINIVLKQNVDLGLSGGLTLAASTADRYMASGNVGYQSGPVTLFTSYGFNTDEQQITGLNNRENLRIGQSPVVFTNQDINGGTSNGGHNLNTTLDYRLNKRDVLTNSLILNLRGSTDGSLSAFRELNGSQSLLSRYGRRRDLETDNSMIDYALAFKRTLEPQRHELSAELRFNRADDQDRNLLWKQPFTLDGGTTGARLEGETTTLDALTHQFTAQTDYTRTLASRTKLETGYKGNARWLDRDYQVLKDSLGSGNWARSSLSNSLELDEQVHAAYGVLSHGTGKLDLQGGLRMEYASRDFTLGGSDSYPHNYVSLFPSGVVAYKPNDNTQLKLSYSRRIRRPGSQELNPFPVFFDVSNVFLGNPRLNAEYTDAIELGYQRSGKLGSLQVSPFYRHTSDIIRIIINTADTISGKEVTSVSFKNLATGSSWGTDVNGQVRLKAFSGFASFNVFKMVTEGSGAESSLASDAIAWSTRFNGTLNVSPRTAFQGMYMYRAPMKIERGRFAAMSMASVSMRHRLPGDKTTLSLRVSDPFNAMRFRVEAGDDNVVQITERKFNSRALHLTLQYNFGKTPKIRQRTVETESTPGFVP